MNQDYLCHWKYIKKKRGKNGKWRYYYDDSTLKRYDNNESVTKNVNGVTTTTEYRKGNGIFDNQTTYTTRVSGVAAFPSGKIRGKRVPSKSWDVSYKTVRNVKEQGKLSRSYAKAEKFIYNTFYKKNSKVNKLIKSSKKQINNGRKFVQSIFDKGR